MESERKREMMNKIAWAINNCQSLSREELKKICDEAIEFKMNLPVNERGKFGWESCLEGLCMLAL